MTVVALVGRPNVGKSTLFNRLTAARDALVANRPGLTRDRQYGIADLDGRTIVVIDTGGLANDVDDAGMASLVAEQANVAIDESDWVVFLVNARDGLTAADEDIADHLRRRGARILLVANKIDGVAPETALADFSRLGFGVPLLVSAAHGRGLAALRETLSTCAAPPNPNPRPPKTDPHPPKPDTHPPESDTHPPESDTHPPESDTHPPEADSHTLEVDTHTAGATETDTHTFETDTHTADAELDSHPAEMDSHVGRDSHTGAGATETDTHTPETDTHTADAELDSHPAEVDSHVGRRDSHTGAGEKDRHAGRKDTHTGERDSHVYVRKGERSPEVPKVAVVGRPNVGKSTLVNRLLGDTRQIVSETPGTTRDAVYLPFRRGNSDYLLIDTAGVRRRGRVRDVVEKFSVAKTLEALSRADVALVLIDAREGLVDQDLNILRYAADSGTGLILTVNKWDGLSREERAVVRKGIDRRMRFAPWVPTKFVSALRGTGVAGLMRQLDDIYAATGREASPAELTRILTRATTEHPPPAVGGRPIRLRFAHKVGSRPPVIAVHGNRTSALPASYVRYLENVYRDTLSLAGVPVKITLQSGDNPFADKRNELSRRQRLRRRRIIRRDSRR